MQGLKNVFFVVCIDISITNLILANLSSSRKKQGLHAENSFFNQVQSRRIYRPCGAQIHTIVHHRLKKRAFDSWFLAQLDGSYLFLFFWQQPLLFKTKTIKTGNIWQDGRKPKMTCCVLLVQPQKSICFQMPS